LGRCETDHAVDTSPAVIDGIVFVGSADGNVYALGAEADSTLARTLSKYHRLSDLQHELSRSSELPCVTGVNSHAARVNGRILL